MTYSFEIWVKYSAHWKQITPFALITVCNIYIYIYIYIHIYMCLWKSTGALSGWMRYTGYHLSGRARKHGHGVPTVEDCWGVCLQETAFKCLSVAYVDGSQSCSLYDTRAMLASQDWTISPQTTYYEYCVDGEWRLILLFSSSLCVFVHTSYCIDVPCVRS